MADIATEVLSATIRKPSQAERMRGMIYRDQHGRAWSGMASLSGDFSLHPCSPIAPYGWTAIAPALVPIQEDMVFGAMPGTFQIDYDRWISRAAVDTARYEEHLRDRAQALFPSSPADAIARRDPLLMQAAGRAPMHVDFVRAMSRGNPWVLGIKKPDGTSYLPPERLVPLLPTLERIETYGGTISADLLRVAEDEFLSPDEEPMVAAVQDDAEFGEVIPPRAARAARPRPTAR